jgi:hypothetical protein
VISIHLLLASTPALAWSIHEGKTVGAGLPDGIFSNQKFWCFLEGLDMEDVGIFYGPLVYFTAIWCFRWTFGIFRGNLVYFPPFWYVVTRKSWQPRVGGKLMPRSLPKQLGGHCFPNEGS